MGVLVSRLGGEHIPASAELWRSANLARRQAVGLDTIEEAAPALDRPGAFGVGVFDGDVLVSAGVAMPARADDGRSEHNIPGLAHISTVATRPNRWGEHLAVIALQAVMSQARRRGFARCQLWTFASNPGARRLYEREGFQLSSRTRSHERQGEQMVHYLQELTAPAAISRPAARIVCLDDRDRVLLMHWRDPVDGHQLWEPPGGGLEADEAPREAALREWVEETGLPAPELIGEPTTVARDVFWNGGRLVTDEVFFLARMPSARTLEPTGFTQIESQSYLGHAWVGRSELVDLEAAGDPVEPDLPPVLHRLGA